MLTSYLNAYKTLIFSKRDSAKMPVARLMDFVINSKTGIFEAVWVEAMGGLKLISPKDIMNWDEEEIIISDESEILDPDSFPRLKNIQEKEVPILQAPVFVGKNLIGKVIDFAFDTISPRILSLTVKSGFWIFGVKRIISHNQILKMTKKGITVSEPKIKVSDLEKKKEVIGQVPNLGENSRIREERIREK